MDDELIDDLERMIPDLCSLPIPQSFLKRFADQGVHPRSFAFGVLIDAILHKTNDESRVRKADSLVRQMVGELEGLSTWLALASMSIARCQTVLNCVPAM